MARSPLPPGVIEEDGRVRVWSLVENCWIRRFPIDAREMLDFGQAALDEPKPEPAPPPAPAPKAPKAQATFGKE